MIILLSLSDKTVFTLPICNKRGSK